MCYEEFVELYNDYTISTYDIKRKLGVGPYSRCYKKAIEKGDVVQRPYNLRFDTDKIKYYYFDKRRQLYRVRKVHKGKFICFGYYDSEEKAKDIVEKCKECDWDKKIMEQKGYL